MIEDYITQISKAINNQRLNDVFESLLQLGSFITDYQLKQYQTENIDAQEIDLKKAQNMPFTLEEIVSKYSIKEIESIPPRAYELYLSVCYDTINDGYFNAVAKETYFDIKTVFAPLKIGVLLYQSVYENDFSDEIYDHPEFDLLAQSLNQLIKDKLKLYNVLNQSGVDVTSTEYFSCQLECLYLFNELVNKVETMTDQLLNKLNVTDKLELSQLVFTYKHALYPLISHACIYEKTEDEKIAISQSLISLNQWFQTSFIDYQKYTWFSFPSFPFFKKGDDAFNYINKDLFQSLALS